MDAGGSQQTIPNYEATTMTNNHGFEWLMLMNNGVNVDAGELWVIDG